MKYDEKSQINLTNKGKVFCNKNILLTVINLAAKEISGVSRLCDSFASQISKIFSNNFYEGVKIAYTKEGIVINVYLNVYYGVRVSDVVYKVQESIKNGISSMIDIKINSINIHVMGVDFKSEE